VVQDGIEAANASIKPVQVSIEGLARHAVSLHDQQAGSFKLRNDDLLLAILLLCLF
jgi:hypothetical protein